MNLQWEAPPRIWRTRSHKSNYNGKQVIKMVTNTVFGHVMRSS